jgi:hypothetical protein
VRRGTLRTAKPLITVPIGDWIARMDDTEAATILKAHIAHLRTVHFGFLATCIALFAASRVDPLYGIQSAAKQLDIVQKIWSDASGLETFQIATEIRPGASGFFTLRGRGVEVAGSPDLVRAENAYVGSVDEFAGVWERLAIKSTLPIVVGMSPSHGWLACSELGSCGLRGHAVEPEVILPSEPHSFYYGTPVTLEEDNQGQRYLAGEKDPAVDDSQIRLVVPVETAFVQEDGTVAGSSGRYAREFQKTACLKFATENECRPGSMRESFPDLFSFAEEHDSSTTSFTELSRQIDRELRAPGNSVAIGSVSLPAEVLKPFGILTIALFEIYFLLHLHRFLALRADPFLKSGTLAAEHYPWIGIYQDCPSRAFFVLSILVPPTAAAIGLVSHSIESAAWWRSHPLDSLVIFLVVGLALWCGGTARKLVPFAPVLAIEPDSPTKDESSGL